MNQLVISNPHELQFALGFVPAMVLIMIFVRSFLFDLAQDGLI